MPRCLREQPFNELQAERQRRSDEIRIIVGRIRRARLGERIAHLVDCDALARGTAASARDGHRKGTLSSDSAEKAPAHGGRSKAAGRKRYRRATRRRVTIQFCRFMESLTAVRQRLIRKRTPMKAIVRRLTILSVWTFLASLVMLGASAIPTAQSRFSGIVVFGTSLSDPGNAFALSGDAGTPPDFTLNPLLVPSAPYAKGGHHFSNGATWIEQFAR